MSSLNFLLDLGVTGWLVIVSTFLLSKWFLTNKTWTNSPPGPPSLPVIGSLLSLPDKDFRIALLKLRQKYGDIFRLDLGMQKTIVLNGYDVLNEALLKHGELFIDRPNLPLGTDYRKDLGFALTSGGLWRRQRRFIVHTLRNFGWGKNRMEATVKEEAHNLVTEFSNMIGEPFDPFPLLCKGTSNVIMSFAFNKRCDYNDPEFLESIRFQDDMMRLLNGGGVLNFFPFLRDFPGDPLKYHQLKDATVSLANLCNKWIVEKKRSMKEGDEPNDYIEAYLLKLKEVEDDPDTVFTERQLAWNLLDLFAAGTDTSATTVTFILLYMILHPDIQDQVFAEIDKVVGSGRPPCLQDRTNLPYTDAVFSEVQRHCALVPLGVPHAATEDTTLRGYTVPKGMNIYTNWHSVLKDETLWPDPDRFDPGRFLDENGKYRKKPGFVLFALGKRNCVGESLARCEVFLLAASILQRFKVAVPEGTEKPRPESKMGIVCHPEPFEMVIEPRASLN